MLKNSVIIIFLNSLAEIIIYNALYDWWTRQNIKKICCLTDLA